MKVAALLVLGQGVTIAVVLFVVVPKIRALIVEARTLIALLGLVFQQTNEAVSELQRHRGILRFQKPESPEDEPPTFIG